MVITEKNIFKQERLGKIRKKKDFTSDETS